MEQTQGGSEESSYVWPLSNLNIPLGLYLKEKQASKHMLYARHWTEEIWTLFMKVHGKWARQTHNRARTSLVTLESALWMIYPCNFPKTISVTPYFLVVPHYSHLVYICYSNSGNAMRRVLFVTLILVGKKISTQKKSNSEFKIPQVTVVPYFSMLIICTLFSEW